MRDLKRSFRTRKIVNGYLRSDYWEKLEQKVIEYDDSGTLSEIMIRQGLRQ